MNNNLPLVSIVVASYNNGQYLEECLESAVNQTYQNIEIIIADDCSTDNSREIIEKFIIKYPDIKMVPVFNEKNMGACNSLNNAIFNYCSGEWIKFLDSDDYLTVDSVAILIKNLTIDTACIYGKTFIMYGECVVGEFGSSTNLDKLINCHNTIPTCSAMIKASSFHDILGFPVNGYVGDLYLWTALAISGGEIKFVDKVVSNYRRFSSPHAMTSSNVTILLSNAENYLHIGRVFGRRVDCVNTALRILYGCKYAELVEVTERSKIEGLIFYFLNFFKIFRYSEKKAVLYLPLLIYNTVKSKFKF